MFEQTARGSLSDAGDFEELCRAVAHLASFAMEGYGKAVSFVADELDQVKDW